MLILNTLKWGNAFSYGDNNEISFSDNKLVQLLGKNGHGKTSIALILEEVLFNTNSKKIKRSGILNRNSSSKSYWIELTFTKFDTEYRIKTVRGSTQTVTLWENGVDISEHTATNTYKLIEAILGMDHKTFTQIVNQSSAFSLEFLTSTDTYRKKFLIDFFNLEKYTKGSEYFKNVVKETSNKIEVTSAKLKNIEAWLTKISSENLVKRDLVEVPSPLHDSAQELSNILSTLSSIDDTNKSITQTNTYISIFEGLSLVEVPVDSKADVITHTAKLENINKDISKCKATISSNNLNNRCSTCGQPIDVTHKVHIVSEAKIYLEQLEKDKSVIEKSLNSAKSQAYECTKAIENNNNWEKYYKLVNGKTKQVLLDKQVLETTAASLRKEIAARNKLIDEINKRNTESIAINTKIDVILSQIDVMNEDRIKYSNELTELNTLLTNQQLLSKTFSTTGLVAYKIESCIKDLEVLTNEYLLDLSDGRFNIEFKINSSDKLNVIINDNGTDIDISALSNGELARVNVASLLALRKLLQNISSCQINLLVLDETIDSLDDDGKEKLIEALIEENYLNTILVSHGFSHPLLVKYRVIKDNNISRIENG